MVHLYYITNHSAMTIGCFKKNRQKKGMKFRKENNNPSAMHESFPAGYFIGNEIDIYCESSASQ